MEGLTALHALDVRSINPRLVKRPLERINAGNPLLALSELGFTPTQIKELIVGTLTPFFENPSILNEVDVGLLAIEGTNVGKITTDPEGEQFLQLILGVYRAAYRADADATFDVIASWDETIQISVREFWNQCLFEINKEDLDLEHFRFEAFRNIGGVAEACIQPYLREGLALTRIAAGGSPDLGSMAFGQVVRDYSRALGDTSFLAPQPWGLFLSDWRNIAQHHSSRVDGESIVATYGRPDSPQTITLTRSELLDVLRRVFFRLSIVKSARNIFTFDHFEEAKRTISDLEPGEPSILFQLSSALATQGFQVVDSGVTDNDVTIILRDMQPGCNHGRMAHCTQFPITVWLHYRKPLVRIRYLDSDGILHLTIETDGADMERITANGEIDWEGLADCLRLTPEISEDRIG